MSDNVGYVLFAFFITLILLGAEACQYGTNKAFYTNGYCQRAMGIGEIKCDMLADVVIK